MALLLAIDAGNTNIVFALYQGEQRLHLWRLKTDVNRTVDEYRAWLGQLLSLEGLSFADIKDVIISSVVPNIDFQLERLCQDSLGRAPFFVSYQDLDLEITLARPEHVGADRLVNIVSLLKDYKSPAIIIDFGTATTFDVVDA